MAIYDVSTLGTSTNKIVFNDFDHVQTPTTDPLYRVQKRTPTRREIRDFDIPIPETSGIADFQTFIGRSFFIIEGTMYPDDEAGFHTGREKLRKLSSLTIQQEDPNSDGGYVPYAWTENVSKQMFVKVEYVDMPETTRQGIVQPFRILCKVKRPVIYSGSTQGGVIGVTTPPLSSGNSGVPFLVPVLVGASVYTFNGTFVNIGDLATYPSFVIAGPTNRPRITNNVTGEYIELDVNLGVSDSVSITYDEDSIAITQGGNSVYNKLTTGSTLFKIKPGSVTFGFSGTSVSPGASATVAFNSAWPLS